MKNCWGCKITFATSALYLNKQTNKQTKKQTNRHIIFSSSSSMFWTLGTIFGEIYGAIPGAIFVKLIQTNNSSANISFRNPVSKTQASNVIKMLHCLRSWPSRKFC